MYAYAYVYVLRHSTEPKRHALSSSRADEPHLVYLNSILGARGGRRAARAAGERARGAA